MTINSFFCKCNKNISGSYYLVNFLNALCTKCKCRNSLCSADLINLIYTCFMCCHKRYRIYLSVFSGWCCHNYLLNTCNLCRYDVHKHWWRIYRFSARHINAYSCERCYLLSEKCSVSLAVKPTVTNLFLVIVPDIYKSFSYYLNKMLIHLSVGFFYLLISYLECLLSNLYTVKFFSVFKQCLVLVCSDILYNVIYSIFKFTVLVRTSL